MLPILLLFLLLANGQTCGFTNYNFTEPLTNGWTIGETSPTPYIDGNNYLVLGDTTTETTGNASVYQDFTITSCDQNLTITYAACTKDNSFEHDQQFVMIKNPGDDSILATYFRGLLGFNLPFANNWFTIQFNVCSGPVNLTDLGVSPLRLELKVHQSGNLNSMGQETPTAFIIKEVCLQ